MVYANVSARARPRERLTTAPNGGHGPRRRLQMSRTSDHTQALTVLHSFRGPVPSTNPYLVMVRDAIESVPGSQVRTFTWKRAIFGRYDVFHVHWPEHILTGSNRLKAAVVHLTALVFLARLRV